MVKKVHILVLFTLLSSLIYCELGSIDLTNLESHRSEDEILNEHFYTDHKYMQESKMLTLCYELFAKMTIKKAKSLEKKLDVVHEKREKLSLLEYKKLYEIIFVQSYVKFIYSANRKLTNDDAKHF